MSAVHTHMRLWRLFVLLKKMWVCVNRLEQGCHMCSGLVITALPVLTAGDTLIASAQPACLLVLGGTTRLSSDNYLPPRDWGQGVELFPLIFFSQKGADEGKRGLVSTHTET